MHSIVLYIVVLIIDDYYVVGICIPTCGHRASYGLHRAPIDVHCRATLCAVGVVVVVRLENAKNWGQSAGNQTPSVDFKVGFHFRYATWIQYITRHPSIYNFLYICTMEIEVRSTLHTGLMVGFACYPPEKHFSYNDVSIYLLIISVHFRWY